MHKKLKAPIYMTKKHLSKDMADIFGSLGEFPNYSPIIIS